MNFVLDASVALSWCFVDEATPESVHLLRQLETHTAFVPALWSLEVGNSLLSAIRRKRLTLTDATQFLSLIKQLKIEIDTEMEKNDNQKIFFLAHTEKLTTYDATYLELAMRRSLPLATRDQALRDAASRVGVNLI